MKMPRRIVFLFLALVFASCNLQATDVPVCASAVDIPFEYSDDNGIITIFVKVNGTKARFLVDTGASLTCIDTGFANQLKISCGDNTSSIATLSKQNVSGKYAIVKSLKFATLADLEIYVGVVDLATLKIIDSSEGRSAIVGILGSDVMRRCGAVVNYEQRVLRLMDPGSWGLTQMQGDWTATHAQCAGRKCSASGLNVHISSKNISINTGLRDGVKALRGKIACYRSASPSAFVIYDIEHIDPPLTTARGQFAGMKLVLENESLYNVVGLFYANSDTMTITLPNSMMGSCVPKFPKTLMPSSDSTYMVITLVRSKRNILCDSGLVSVLQFTTSQILCKSFEVTIGCLEFRVASDLQFEITNKQSGMHFHFDSMGHFTCSLNKVFGKTGR